MNGLSLYTQKVGGGAGQASMPLTCGQDALNSTKNYIEMFIYQKIRQESTVEFEANQSFTSFRSCMYFYPISPLCSLNLTYVTVTLQQ